MAWPVTISGLTSTFSKKYVKVGPEPHVQLSLHAALTVAFYTEQIATKKCISTIYEQTYFLVTFDIVLIKKTESNFFSYFFNLQFWPF